MEISYQFNIFEHLFFNYEYFEISEFITTLEVISIIIFKLWDLRKKL